MAGNSKLTEVWVNSQNKLFRRASKSFVELGASSTSIFIQLDSSNLLRSLQGAFSPPAVDVSAYAQVDGATPTAYLGRFIISESDDGFVYTPVYTSSVDESSHTYSPTSLTMLKVRFSLFQSGGATTLLDSIDILVSGAAEIDSVYANNAPPTNNIENLSFISQKNADGSVNVTASWEYTQGAAQADGFLLYFPSDSSAPGEIDLVNDPHVFVSADARSYTLAAISAYELPEASDALVRHYRFGMIAVGLRSAGIVPATAGIVEASGWIDKTFASSTVATSEGGSTLSVEGQSLVWRSSVTGAELGRIRNDVALSMLKASNLAALVRYRGLWTFTFAWTELSSYGTHLIDGGAVVSESSGKRLYWVESSGISYRPINSDGSLGTVVVESTHPAHGSIYFGFCIARADGSVLSIYSKSGGYFFECAKATNGTWGAERSLGFVINNTGTRFTEMLDGSIIVSWVTSGSTYTKRRNMLGVWGPDTLVHSGSPSGATGVYSCIQNVLTYLKTSQTLFFLKDYTSGSAKTVLCSAPIVLDDSANTLTLGAVSELVELTYGVWAFNIIATPTLGYEVIAQKSNANLARAYYAAGGSWSYSSTNLLASVTDGLVVPLTILESGLLVAFYTRYPSGPTNQYAASLGGAFATIPNKDDYAFVGSGIVEVGENANGRYWKYGDGTLECEKEVTASKTVNSTSGSVFYASSTFLLGNWAYPFIATPNNVQANIVGNGTFVWLFPITNVSATSAGDTNIASSATRTSTAYTVHVRARGRWM